MPDNVRNNLPPFLRLVNPVDHQVGGSKFDISGTNANIWQLGEYTQSGGSSQHSLSATTSPRLHWLSDSTQTTQLHAANFNILGTSARNWGITHGGEGHHNPSSFFSANISLWLPWLSVTSSEPTTSSFKTSNSTSAKSLLS